jgi:hypothetical protein
MRCYTLWMGNGQPKGSTGRGPLTIWVAMSLSTIACRTSPYLENSWRSVSSVTESGRLPTYSLQESGSSSPGRPRGLKPAGGTRREVPVVAVCCFVAAQGA